MRFFNFYVAYMVQKYQNESAPIFYYGKSPKTSRKHLNIPYLQALTLGRIIKMTLYLDLNECFGTMFYMKWYHHYEIIIIYFKIYISHFQLSVNKTSLWCTSNILDLLYVTLHVYRQLYWYLVILLLHAVSININILLKFRHD